MKKPVEAQALRVQKRISIRTASDVAQLFWPDFVEVNGCVFAAFQPHGGDPKESFGGKTGRECFVNHTHIFDEFRNKATSAVLTRRSERLQRIDEKDDDTPTDYIL